MNKICIIFCFSLILQQLIAQDTLRPDFADFLYQETEYYRAVTEYKRFLFENKNASLSDYCNLQITRSYYYGEDYESAAHHIEKTLYKPISDTITFNKLQFYGGLCLLKSGYPESALIQFNRQKSRDANALFGIANLYLRNWQQAETIFMDLPTDGNSLITTNLQSNLIETAQNGQKLKFKKPAIAGVLSAVVPGAGYAYSKHYQTALSALILNTVLIGTTYELQKRNMKFSGSAVFVISFGWYIGNIFGSVSAAKRYNTKLLNDFLNAKLTDFNSVVF